MFGSGGRAAAAIATYGTKVIFHTYTSPKSQSYLEMVASAYKLEIQTSGIARAVAFSYLHDLADPHIAHVPPVQAAPLQIQQDHVVRFGMLEGDAIVQAKWAVYDPQNQGAPIPFGANGSHAEHLALVLNSWEAQQMAGLEQGDAEACARKIAQEQHAEVVIVKQGAQGALVWANQQAIQVPAYRTTNVWKIGSGDCFVAYFAQAWMEQALTPADAADFASRATAYYVDTKGFATPEILKEASYPAISPQKGQPSTVAKKVYLAGPFFHLGQIWLINQARTLLQSTGLQVISPFHDIGLGTAEDVVPLDIQAIKDCDLVFAAVDGLDPGTIFELGYARSLDKPVVIYSETQVGTESLKMMQGTGCEIYDNFTTAIYATRWRALES
ncbi:PfkB family carbohydrate kinase [Comamonas aquatica]|uniref:PfkB family carbohydrate kinase n=1 Tax=Comamonas aquatica TaxID=225991 RepID=UPI0024470A5C|nr:PfkB family carbohydrate kinase [Comamonas aquatica]MDH1902105.1 PfkB family carbohydrate kinase [Comamonas aquatica]